MKSVFLFDIFFINFIAYFWLIDDWNITNIE